MINSALLRYDGGKGLPPPLGRRYIDAIIFLLRARRQHERKINDPEKRKYQTINNFPND